MLREIRDLEAKLHEVNSDTTLAELDGILSQMIVNDQIEKASQPVKKPVKKDG